MTLTLDLPAKETPRAPKPVRTTRRANSFQGAKQDRSTASWITDLISADGMTRVALKTLRARSRDLCENNPHVAGLRQTFADSIIGTEIDVSPKMVDARGVLLKPQNDLVWKRYRRFCEQGECTADGQNGQGAEQRLVLDTWFADGEAFIRQLPGFENAFGYATQLLDADMLDESFNVPKSQGQNQISQGIELNQWGRPVRYHFYRQHPRDQGFTRERVAIPAEEIIHLFVQRRPNQRRGVPILTPVMIAFRMFNEYTNAEVDAALNFAQNCGFLTSKGEDAERVAASMADEEPGSEQEPIELIAEGSVLRQLPPGLGLEQFSPDHPNSNFGEFQMAILRMISAGVGVSSMTLSHNASDANFSSMRAGLLPERDMWKTTQEWFGTRYVARNYRAFLKYGSLANMVPLPTPDAKLWGDCKLDYRGFPYVNPKDDATTDNLRLAGKLTSPQRVAAAEGVDVEDILDEWEEFHKMCEERGLEVPNFGDVIAAQAAAAPESETVTPPTKKTPQERRGYRNGHSSWLPVARNPHLKPLEIAQCATSKRY